MTWRSQGDREGWEESVVRREVGGEGVRDGGEGCSRNFPHLLVNNSHNLGQLVLHLDRDWQLDVVVVTITRFDSYFSDLGENIVRTLMPLVGGSGWGGGGRVRGLVWRDK